MVEDFALVNWWVIASSMLALCCACTLDVDESIPLFPRTFTSMESLQERFRFLTEFDNGKSSAKVLLIEDSANNQQYVLKLFDAIQQTDASQRFMLSETEMFRELFISLQMMQLQRKNTQFMSSAEVCDYGVVWDHGNILPYYITEYASGITMKQYIHQHMIAAARSTTDPVEIKSILFQILYFMKIAFEELQFVHQDIHFNNIQITNEKLSDFRISDGNVSVVLNGPKIKIFDFGYSTVDVLPLARPGTHEWTITEKGKPEFRHSVCMANVGEHANETHFVWKEQEVIKKQTCMMDELCVQFSAVLVSFVCENSHVFVNVLDDAVQRYMMKEEINYDLRHWLFYFLFLNANSGEPFIECDTFESCVQHPYFDELRSNVYMS